MYVSYDVVYYDVSPTRPSQGEPSESYPPATTSVPTTTTTTTSTNTTTTTTTTSSSSSSNIEAGPTSARGTLVSPAKVTIFLAGVLLTFSGPYVW